MSEALDAMVTAMAAEIARQDADDARTRAEEPWLEATDGSAYNLEKVARAGLMAIWPAVNEAIVARRAIYEAKAAKRDGLAPDTLNEHEKHEFAAEAVSYVAVDVGTVFDAILATP